MGWPVTAPWFWSKGSASPGRLLVPYSGPSPRLSPPFRLVSAVSAGAPNSFVVGKMTHPSDALRKAGGECQSCGRLHHLERARMRRQTADPVLEFWVTSACCMTTKKPGVSGQGRKRCDQQVEYDRELHRCRSTSVARLPLPSEDARRVAERCCAQSPVRHAWQLRKSRVPGQKGRCV